MLPIDFKLVSNAFFDNNVIYYLTTLLKPYILDYISHDTSNRKKDTNAN